MDRQELLRQAAQTYLTPCYQNAASLALAAGARGKKGAPVSGGFLPVQQHSDTQL